MLLTLDVGNTQTAVGLFAGDALVGHWRMTTNPELTSDEMRLALRGMLGLGDYDPAAIDGVAISCVVPAITVPLRGVAETIAPGAVTVVEPGTKTGMPISIDNPREVGADRVVNAVAARKRYGAPVVVVDFGTSTNFDVVGPDGDYLGGAIAPGLVLSTNALTRGAAALRNVEFLEPRSPIGKGTVEAIQSGALYGHAGLVDGIMERLVAALGVEATRVATGGLASTIVAHCSSVETIDPYLTLEGLRIIHDLNRDT
ncbi:MAG: type III pantothenate kinase [Actinobacteria bacterium]|uniref:Type III pantothenate kinase n=1 Tax=hydrothermal vent metagenome TaxID=652676 RepID=A0A3B0TM24_9ZZZZ|nr:type III pantothenate kinase [Actinomycetota bacterium]